MGRGAVSRRALETFMSEDEVARLREENERLRAALKPFADEAARRSWMDAAGLTEMRGWNIGGSALTNADLARAAELLAGSPAPA